LYYISILEWILEKLGRRGLGSCGSGQGLAAVSCEHGNEYLGSTKGGELTE